MPITDFVFQSKPEGYSMPMNDVLLQTISKPEGYSMHIYIYTGPSLCELPFVLGMRYGYV